MQKFMRAVMFGTNNIDCCARVPQPHRPGHAAHLRHRRRHQQHRRPADTDTIMVIGANPTDAHPVTGARIKQQVMKGKMR
ncbi:MAG: hypothetical protein R2810_03605 [Flavobacteriales bacterium]